MVAGWCSSQWGLGFGRHKNIRFAFEWEDRLIILTCFRNGKMVGDATYSYVIDNNVVPLLKFEIMHKKWYGMFGKLHFSFSYLNCQVMDFQELWCLEEVDEIIFILWIKDFVGYSSVIFHFQSERKWHYVLLDIFSIWYTWCQCPSSDKFIKGKNKLTITNIQWQVQDNSARTKYYVYVCLIWQWVLQNHSATLIFAKTIF